MQTVSIRGYESTELYDCPCPLLWQQQVGRKTGASLQVTLGCSHNKCKFCSMYNYLTFQPIPLEWIEDTLEDIAEKTPDVTVVRLQDGNPLALPYEQLVSILELIHQYLPAVTDVGCSTRVTDFRNKTPEQLLRLRKLGVRQVSLGVESGDDWTLDRIEKGYHAADILGQCRKLDEAGIAYWMTFLNGAAGRSHSREHALHSAEIFSRCHPQLIGTGELILFPNTALREEADRGEFDPLTAEERTAELALFVEHLECDCIFATNHPAAAALCGADFLSRKAAIAAALRQAV